MATKGAIRFGAIGCGGAGTHRIRELANHELGLDVVAAADINPARLDNLEQVLGHKFARYDTPNGYRAMVDDLDLDAVGIFTPHIPHYEHARYALERGKHMLIEKPMVCGAANAVEIAQLADANDCIAVLHYQRHYQGCYIKARELIRKGVIGDVQSFYVYMAQDWSGRTWRGDPAFSGGGQINDSGSHYQDVLLWMTDLLPRSAEGSVDTFYHGEEKQVQINGLFSVELENGAGGRIIIVGDTIGGFTDDVRIRGAKGDLVFYGNSLIHRPHGKAPTEVSTTPPRNYPRSPCDNFVKLIRGRARVNRVPLIFGARVALLTDTLLTAAAQGRRIDCDELLGAAGYSAADLR